MTYVNNPIKILQEINGSMKFRRIKDWLAKKQLKIKFIPVLSTVFYVNICVRFGLWILEFCAIFRVALFSVLLKIFRRTKFWKWKTGHKIYSKNFVAIWHAMMHVRLKWPDIWRHDPFDAKPKPYLFSWLMIKYFSPWFYNYIKIGLLK